MRLAYPIKLQEVPEDHGFAVIFPDLPEAITWGDTRADALINAVDCLEEALAGYIKQRREIPAPSLTRGRPTVAPGSLIASKAALYLALTMPDICGALENPSSKIRNRYESWFKKYLGGLYPPDLFSASDCYYLRCSALHQGFPTHRKAQAKRFAFLAPVPNISMHCCFSKPEEGKFVLLLQVDIFCTDIVRGVERWLDDVVGQEEILKQISGMLTFMDGRSPMDLT